MQPHDIAQLVNYFSKENPLRIEVITMSDRAHSGAYEDLSGTTIYDALDTFFKSFGIGYAINTRILPDEADQLEQTLIEMRDSGTHAVFTTGGTGVGPRDITTDVVLKLADKTIPGIMEAVRGKYGTDKPLSLLSRTVAAVMGETLVYTLPGSPKGVTEYMGEILKTFDHLLCVLRGLDEH